MCERRAHRLWQRELGGCLQFEVLARSRSRSLHSVVNRVEQRFTAR